MVWESKYQGEQSMWQITAFIDLKSIEAHIIADAMESGFDATKALLLVNKDCQEIGKEDLYILTPA